MINTGLSLKMSSSVLYSIDEIHDPQTNNSGELPSSNAAQIRVSASLPSLYIGEIMLTQQRLKELLRYNPETGVFTWINKPSRRIPAGREAGCLAQHGYKCIGIDGILYYAHRLAWLYNYGEWPKTEIDHINGVRDDNRLGNIRSATRAQNGANVRVLPPNKIGYRGVCRSGLRYTSKIKVEGRVYWLGTFDTPQEAHAAYCKKGRELLGEYFYGGKNG